MKKTKNPFRFLIEHDNHTEKQLKIDFLSHFKMNVQKCNSVEKELERVRGYVTQTQWQWQRKR